MFLQFQQVIALREQKVLIALSNQLMDGSTDEWLAAAASAAPQQIKEKQ